MRPSLTEYPIEPNVAAGPIRFGMSAPQVHAQLSTVHTSAGGIDRFEDLGLRVHYGPDEGVEAVEFVGPAVPTLDGRALLQQRYAELEAWIASIDAACKREHSGLTSIQLGIRLYAPSARNRPEARVEGVTAFDNSYARRYIASIWPPAPLEPP